MEPGSLSLSSGAGQESKQADEAEGSRTGLTVLLSRKDGTCKQDGFSKDLLEVISKLSPFSESLGVTLVTLRKMVPKTLNNLAVREFSLKKHYRI